MLRRIGLASLLTILGLSIVACHNKRVQNPLANLGSKQPDVVLFDRAMDALKHNKFDQGRMLLQTLINAYPDSEYIARAKLGIGDSWYAEGGTAALAQAENEYKDFITFFPNMSEAAEAQMKIANIHFRQMEKPDRDFTHAKRAEEEYRTMVLQYPDSPLVPQAMQRLREVQEVLAEREFLVGRFYYLRESWAASIARLQSLVDTYPLYSGADEALYMLGQAYERQYDTVKAAKGLTEAQKERLGKPFADKAADAYARIVTRYPIMPRAEDAKKRLLALGRDVPVPTEAAIAQNKAEEQGRREAGTVERVMNVFHRGPILTQAARVGEPTLVDPRQTSAPEIVKQTNEAIINAAKGEVSLQPVKEGAPPPPNQPVPRSDNPAQPSGGNAQSAPDNAQTAAKPAGSGIPELIPLADPDASAQPAGGAAPPPTEAKTQAPPVAPPPVNEIAPPQPGQAQATANDKKAGQAAASKNDKQKKDGKDSASSKKKKKKLWIF